ncbi:MAG: LysR family transcriptional regulator [Emcibacter sp.]|nr:LysR family transcriptional regulator [Emcibacter sp.]
MDTLVCMRVFANVVEKGSFTGAAKHLGLSNALASKYVAHLEEKLDARLLNRTTRKVSPTQVGRAYYEKCIDILEMVDELENTVQLQTGTPRGHLKIAGPRIMGEAVLAACVNDFLGKYELVTVDLMLEERTVDLVAEGFDLAVRIGKLADSSMIARWVADYRYVFCAAPDYLANSEPLVQPSDLSHHTCIVNSVISPSNQWEFIINGKRKTITVTPRARGNADAAIYNMILAGRGVGLCLLPTVEADIAKGRLVRVLQDFEAYDRSVYLVYPHRRHLATKVRAFVDHAVEWFK